jgi:hypothetical protein
MGKGVRNGGVLVTDALLRDSCLALLAQPGGTAQFQKIGLLACGSEWAHVISSVSATKTCEVESYAVSVAHGVKPSELYGRLKPRPLVNVLETNRYYRAAYRSAFISHPLHLSLAFSELLNDREEGDWLLQEYQEAGDADKYRGSDFLSVSWIPPYTPESTGRTPFAKPKCIDNISFIAWFDKNSVSELVSNVDSSFIAEAANVSVHLSRPLDLSIPAWAALSSHWGHARPDYNWVTDLLRLVRPHKAHALLDNAVGVRRSFGITRDDATPRQMTHGMRSIAGMTEEAREAMSRLYGRAPTISEIKAVRGGGIVDLLYYMPWVLLENVLKEHSSDLRALTLPHLQHLTGSKRYLLQDHDRRAKLRAYAGREAGDRITVTPNTTTSDWSKVFTGLVNQYQASRSLRNRLLEACQDPVVAAVALMAKFEILDKNLVERVLRHHRNFRRISEVANQATEVITDPDNLVT